MKSKFSYIMSAGCLCVMIYCLAMVKTMQVENDNLTTRVMQLKADSVAQSTVTRRFSRWHWQLDTLIRKQIDSVIRSDKHKRVEQHIASK